ncbi:hypothetical protein AAC387_Pa11g1452 [Persea americana]
MVAGDSAGANIAHQMAMHESQRQQLVDRQCGSDLSLLLGSGADWEGAEGAGFWGDGELSVEVRVSVIEQL